MNYPPCKNPSCKSFGSPHPNCRCYPDMAEGGESNFCASDRAHDSKCQYFANGGDSIDPNQVILDQEPSSPEIDPNKVIVDKTSDDGIDPSKVVLDEDKSAKYSTPGQQLGTIAEGFAQGVAGPVATLAEKGLSKLGVPNMTDEDIAGRQEANPWEHGIAETAGLTGSMMTGVGEAGLLLKGAEAAAGLAKAGKVGSAIIKGAITNGLIQGGDEVSKAMLGQGDPQAPVAGALARVGGAALLGGAFGGVGAKAADVVTNKIQQVTDLKNVAKAAQFLAGAKNAASLEEVPAGVGTDFANGHKFYNGLTTGAGVSAGTAIGAALEPHLGAYSSSMGLKVGEKYLAPFIAKAANKMRAPAVINWLSKGANGSLWQILDYADKVNSGTSLINNGVDSLFKAGSQQAVNAVSEKDIKDLRDYVSDGGVNQNVQQQISDDNQPTPGFADGGLVKEPPPKSEPVAPLLNSHAIATHYPDQNIMLQAAKGRISDYLASMQPQKHQSKLAFDDAPDDTEQNRTYDKALRVAAQPLSVLNHIKNGTIEPEQIKHLSSMYPELTDHLQKKITERITQAQLKGEKPSYKVRQGLSMLMGTSLSGEMTPSSIQAAQAVFAPKQAPTSPAKKGASELAKAGKAFQTPDQARQERQVNKA